MRVLQPPAPIALGPSGRSVFLAGSIEGGRAERWQDRFIRLLGDADLTVLNPRRDAWDASWSQTLDDPRFRGQVEWELEAQERATAIAMYFDPATKAPVTLLELGLFARSGKAVVCCPAGFWRKGNVDVVCARYGVRTAATLEDMAAAMRTP